MKWQPYIFYAHSVVFNSDQQLLLADVFDSAFGAGIFGADVFVLVILQEVLDDIGIEDA